jgi:carbamoyltransferase
MSIIVGINAYHGDAAACIIRNGHLVAAVEEERFLRIKHWAGFPAKSVEYCLAEAGVTLSDVDIIAVNSDPKANLFKKIVHIFKHRSAFELIRDRFRNAAARNSIEENLLEAFPDQMFRGKVKTVEHHLAHLSSAFHVSPYEKASVLSVDGFGDFASGSWGVGEGASITVEGQINYPHSLGAFYQSITQFIGFPNYGDEYKVMGLAPYGSPVYMAEMREIVKLKDDGTYELNLDYFCFHKEKVAYEWDDGSPSVGRLFSENLVELLGPARKKDEELTQRHKDLAASAQAMFEEALFHMLNKLYDSHGLDSLCIAGGCGNNSVANGKIRRMTKFKNVYIAASAGDAGGALGAAYSAYFETNTREVEASLMNHAYVGPKASDDQIAALLQSESYKLPKTEFEVQKVDSVESLVEMTAKAISEGLVIGWFQGRMEWGPRALGNRSILGDPRRADMKEILNQKIKRRESFRPFAPSILREAVAEWFEEDDEVPFMMKVFQVKENKRFQIPAVTHADGSGRLQTVYQKTNPRYHALIRQFSSITGVPILLNTSFNENEPVVCKPEEALDCFLRTKMDVVVLNDYLIRRK